VGVGMSGAWRSPSRAGGRALHAWPAGRLARGARAPKSNQTSGNRSTIPRHEPQILPRLAGGLRGRCLLGGRIISGRVADDVADIATGCLC
jgi:hypothetical protein